MSLVVTLALVLGLIAGGIAYRLFRRQAWVALVVSLVVCVGTAAWCLRPVCVVIPPDAVARFDPPVETRTETGLIGQRYFQKRGGGWYQCKTWIARAFFF